jgi:hypothetical protein
VEKSDTSRVLKKSEKKCEGNGNGIEVRQRRAATGTLRVLARLHVSRILQFNAAEKLRNINFTLRTLLNLNFALLIRL